MKNLYIFTDNFFLKKDFIRFEVNNLNKFFNFKIVSLNKKVIKFNKKINIIYVNNLNELNKIIKVDEDSYVIDLMGISSFSWKVRSLLLDKKFKFIKIMLGMIPFPPKKNILIRIFNNLISKKASGGRILSKINNNIQLLINKNFRYDLSIVSGKVAYNFQLKKRTKKIIKFKSFDTLNYEKTKFLKKKKLPIVFIDNDIVEHKDYKYHGTTSPVEKKKYYKSLDSFFSYLEKKYKTEVIIALNPKSKIRTSEKNFKNRKIFQNKTSELIKNCKFSIVHSSTAISFCVLSKKPVLFITNEEIKKSWFQQEIEFSAAQLKNKVFNIDLLKYDSNIDNYLKINKNCYKNYVKNYLFQKKINKNLSFSKILKINLTK